ncbi:hypothetical protein J608_3724, partial [Acinetobacter baumannii 1288284]
MCKFVQYLELMALSIINTIYNKNLFKKMKNQSYIHP